MGWRRRRSAASPPNQLEQALKDLSSDEEGTREQAIRALIEQGDATWLPRLAELRTNADRSLRMAIKPVADAWRHRANLSSPDVDTRRSAAADLGAGGRTVALPWLEAAAAAESHRWVRYAMDESALMLRLASEDPAAKAQAAVKLGEMRSQNAVPALKELVQAAAEGDGTEHQKTVARAAAAAIDQIETWNVWSTAIETVFRGISLSSILLIMSVGLAIVFGLMGVINMAHGELMMIGAYATFVMQECFKLYFPSAWFDAYYLAALPASFLAAALFGLLLEATVIRFLYGRPLETMLATWGVSLILIQGARIYFGDLTAVSAPAWLNGGTQVMVGVFLPFNRLFIIGLSILCVAGYLCVAVPVDRRIASAGGHPKPEHERLSRHSHQEGRCLHVCVRFGFGWYCGLGLDLSGQCRAGTGAELHCRLLYGGGDRRSRKTCRNHYCLARHRRIE